MSRLEGHASRIRSQDRSNEEGNEDCAVRRRTWLGRECARGIARVLAWVLSTGLLSMAASTAASAAKDSVKDYDRWSPALTFQLGILRQQADGSGVSDRRPEGSEGTPQSGDNLLLDYFFGLSFELMTPSIADVPGHPQPFVHLDVLNPLGVEVDIVREGSPTGLLLPDFGASNSTLPASGVGGQGLKTEAEYKSPSVAVGLGLSFSFELWDLHFRARPSVQYFMEKVEVNGLVLDVDGQQVVVDNVIIEDFTLTRLSRNENKTFHALGGGVELEMDVTETQSRLGRFSLLASVHVYHLIGDRRFEFTSTDGRSFANWGAKLDPMVYRFGFGFRYRFRLP